MRDLDVIVFGATGFTGRLVAEYLARNAGPQLRWAIAGRSRDKLEQVRRDLAVTSPHLTNLPVQVVDTADAAALDLLVPTTRVVCTTIGPYRKYGEELVAACARHGTHYTDITGEVPFIRASIDRNDAIARRSGACIVHACGFDSVPSDLGVHLLRDQARSKLDEALTWAGAFVSVQGLGAPGGVESAIALIQDARRDRALRKLSSDPHALDPATTVNGEADQLGMRYSRELGEWTAPFVMAVVNTRVVRRTTSLLGVSPLRYEESMNMGRGASGLLRASAITAGLGAFVAMAYFRPANRVLRRLVRPTPARQGRYHLQILARTESGRQLAVRIAGEGDPGCEPTAMMLAEYTLALAAHPSLPCGVLTPVSALGLAPVMALRAAGMTIELTDHPAATSTATGLRASVADVRRAS